MGAFHPIAWYHVFEGGRCFVTALGHMPELYRTRTSSTTSTAGSTGPPPVADRCGEIESGRIRSCSDWEQKAAKRSALRLWIRRKLGSKWAYRLREAITLAVEAEWQRVIQSLRYSAGEFGRFDRRQCGFRMSRASSDSRNALRASRSRTQAAKSA